MLITQPFKLCRQSMPDDVPRRGVAPVLLPALTGACFQAFCVVKLKSAIPQEFGGLFFHDALLSPLPLPRLCARFGSARICRRASHFRFLCVDGASDRGLRDGAGSRCEAAAASAIANDWREFLAHHWAGTAFEPVDDLDRTTSDRSRRAAGMTSTA
jgi:hypothetical protein